MSITPEQLAEKAEAFMYDHSSEFRASVRARAASVSAPPGCDFPDPIAKGGSNE